MRNDYRDQKWVGRKYGMLTVLGAAHHISSRGAKEWFWEVQCDCGNKKVMKPHEIINGKVVSCGCYRITRPSATKRHGESHTKLHDIWCGINNRCRHHPRYAGRGICVCNEWAIYENFRDWALENGYEDGLTIERVDVDGNYCPQNCKWIPLNKQARNRTTTKWVEYDGRKMSLAEASELAKLPYKEVHLRIKTGWSVYDALHAPLLVDPNNLHKRCVDLGLNYHTIYNRVYVLGWSVERAINTPILGKGANQTSYGA